MNRVGLVIIACSGLVPTMGFAEVTGVAGNSLPVSTLQPSLGITYAIRTEGLYPGSGGSPVGTLGEIAMFAGNFAYSISPSGLSGAAGDCFRILRWLEGHTAKNFGSGKIYKPVFYAAFTGCFQNVSCSNHVDPHSLRGALDNRINTGNRGGMNNNLCAFDALQKFFVIQHISFNDFNIFVISVFSC